MRLLRLPSGQLLSLPPAQTLPHVVFFWGGKGQSWAPACRGPRSASGWCLGGQERLRGPAGGLPLRATCRAPRIRGCGTDRCAGPVGQARPSSPWPLALLHASPAPAAHSSAGPTPPVLPPPPRAQSHHPPLASSLLTGTVFPGKTPSPAAAPHALPDRGRPPAANQGLCTHTPWPLPPRPWPGSPLPREAQARTSGGGQRSTPCPGGGGSF